MNPVNHTRLIRLLADHNHPVLLIKTFTTQSMSHAWVSKKVVPDVIDDLPRKRLGVEYPEISINEGTIVKPSQTKEMPVVSWRTKDKSLLHALCMVDPDAPSKSKPMLREWIQWLIVNITENNVETGETIAEYIAAAPPTGTDYHRYVFLLFAYPKKISWDEKKITKTSAEGRAKFSVKKFAEKYKLGHPIAGNFFIAEYDEYVPEVLKQLGLK